MDSDLQQLLFKLQAIWPINVRELLYDPSAETGRRATRNLVEQVGFIGAFSDLQPKLANSGSKIVEDLYSLLIDLIFPRKPGYHHCYILQLSEQYWGCQMA
jgi:hypothetical protein